jgi:hypothetical protein
MVLDKDKYGRKRGKEMTLPSPKEQAKQVIRDFEWDSTMDAEWGALHGIQLDRKAMAQELRELQKLKDNWSMRLKLTELIVQLEGEEEHK